MQKKKYVSPQDWTITYGDYLSQCDDYEMQHKKLLKRDKIYRNVFYGLGGVVVLGIFLLVLRIIAKM